MSAMSTKAAITEAEYPTSESFDVYGYWAEDWDNGEIIDYLITTEEGSGVQFVNRGEFWTGKTSYYWPKDGSLKFACYSPAKENLKHHYATDTFSKEYYVQSNNTAETVDLLLAPITPSYTFEAADQNIPVVFQHALSWITIQVKADSEVAAQAFDIKKITINDILTTAKLEAGMADGIQVNEWKNRTTAKDIVVFEGSQYVTEKATPIETVENGTIVIPQQTKRMTIEYTQRRIEGSTAELPRQKIEFDLVLGNNYTQWLPGKHYTYTLIFHLDEIKIKPSIKEWESVSAEDIIL
jgi:hypothetical protein